ncbi:MAG: nucleoside triphosphate pyrophosphatase [Mycobacterium sp.]|jgi:septum formation protein|nr:nucleoside triphosphate pyrophosphatase [Mycobacterium sp.]
MTRVVLASASPGRRRVLRQAGIDPLVIVSGVDEDAVVAALPENTGPAEITLALARAKAGAVARTLEAPLAADCVVIGCDSMLYRGGRLWGKPESEPAALQGWQDMAGQSGELYTGHCVIRMRDNRIEQDVADVAVTGVDFGRPCPEDLAAYVGSGEPTAVAGGFTLDGLGGWFVDGVHGDPSSVIGLGLPLMRRLFERVGLSVTRLWADNPVR